jgi:hypothetical protein
LERRLEEQHLEECIRVMTETSKNICGSLRRSVQRRRTV